MIDSLVFNVQFGLGLVVYGIVASWFVIPWIRTMPRSRALSILLIPHAFRHFAPYALVASAFNPSISENWAKATAATDLATCVVALLGMIAFRRGWAAAIPLTWLCNILGLIAFGWSTYGMTVTQLPLHLLITSWFLPVFYVPILMWSHFYLFRFLLGREP
jgi:hypothetical protein